MRGFLATLLLALMLTLADAQIGIGPGTGHHRGARAQIGVGPGNGHSSPPPGGFLLDGSGGFVLNPSTLEKLLAL